MAKDSSKAQLIGASSSSDRDSAGNIDLEGLTEDERQRVIHEMHLDTNQKMVNITDLLQTVAEKQQTEKTIKYLYIAIAIVSVYAVILTVSGFGLTIAAIGMRVPAELEESKEQRVDASNGVVRVKKGDLHLHSAIAHLDFKLMDAGYLPFDTLREIKQIALFYDGAVKDFGVTGFTWWDYDMVDFHCNDGYTVRVNNEGIFVGSMAKTSQQNMEVVFQSVAPRNSSWTQIQRLLDARDLTVDRYESMVLGGSATEASADYFLQSLLGMSKVFEINLLFGLAQPAVSPDEDRMGFLMSNRAGPCMTETLLNLPALFNEDRFSKGPFCVAFKKFLDIRMAGSCEVLGNNGKFFRQKSGQRYGYRPFSWFFERRAAYSLGEGNTVTNMPGKYSSTMHGSSFQADVAYITETLKAKAAERSKICQEQYRLMDPRNGGGDIETLVGTTEELLGAYEKKQARIPNNDEVRFIQLDESHVAETAAWLLIQELAFWSYEDASPLNPYNATRTFVS